MSNTIIPTNYMITKVEREFGPMAKETLMMKLYVLSYKTNKKRTYEDCIKFYEKVMEKDIDK